MARAIESGLSLSDFDSMTVGMIFDYIITCYNLKYDEAEDSERDGERIATQADFDAF